MSTTINTEKQEYVEKLGNQISALTRILKMDSGTVLSAEIKENIIEYQSEISSYLGHADITFSGAEIQQGGELEKFITAVSTAYAVKEVRIRSGALHEMKNAVIFDVPGFNSPTEMHKAQTKLRMKSADAIIVVASGAEPSITGESLKILRESDDDGNLLSNKLFVFSNKTDRAADIPKNIAVTYREWIEKWGFLNSAQKHRIVFGSALWYLESIKEVSSTIATRGIEERKDQIHKRFELNISEQDFGEIFKKSIRPQISEAVCDVNDIPNTMASLLKKAFIDEYAVSTIDKFRECFKTTMRTQKSAIEQFRKSIDDRDKFKEDIDRRAERKKNICEIQNSIAELMEIWDAVIGEVQEAEEDGTD